MNKLNKTRKDFPVLERKVNGKNLVYLDNAATTQKPRMVLDAMNEFYEKHNANIHRSIHTLGEESTECYEKSRGLIADFIGANHNEIIITKSTTESLNALANTLEIGKGDEVLITEMEHHSNLVPWQIICQRKGARLVFAKITDNGNLDVDDLENKITKKTRVVSVVHASNVLGTINPAREISKLVKDNGSVFILDAAQSAPHIEIDVNKLGCDFLAFSGHKMCGPTGIGVLYGKTHLLEGLDPFLYGGEMIRSVTFTKSEWNGIPHKFEAGTPNIAEAVGLGAAIEYLKAIGMDNIWEHEKKLTSYAMNRIQEIEGLDVYGPEKRLGVISFNIKDVHAHDVGSLLDQDGIATRAGNHCAAPLHSVLGVNGSVRASLYLYNTKEEVDKLIMSLERVKETFGV